MNVVTSIVSHPQPALLMQPSDRALDDVLHFAEPTSMFRAALARTGSMPSQRKMFRAVSES